MDSTSISTYSDANALAQYGHDKRDPELKQINQTFVCDRCSGHILFVHLYDGAVSDVAALQDAPAGRLNSKVYVHLYRLDERFEQQRELIWKNADEIIELKSHNRSVPQDQWDSFERSMVERTDGNGRPV